MNDLAAQGHGPQRHEGQVTGAQHDARERVLRGVDPETGQVEVFTRGPERGQPKITKKSSSFRSNEAYAQAEHAARNSPEFEAQVLAGEKTIYVERLRLDEAIGSDYLRHVEGRTTVDVTKSGTTRAAEFRDGTVFVKYQWNAGTRRYDLVTMYPKGR